MGKQSHSFLIWAAVTASLAAGCQVITKKSELGLSSLSNAELLALTPAGTAAGAGAGNGDGYLGLISTNYQVLPGYQCNDGTSTHLAYSGSLVQTADGRVFLGGDQCTGGFTELQPGDYTKIGDSILARGGYFDPRKTAPDPTVKTDRYNQLNCAFSPQVGTQDYIMIRDNMVGDSPTSETRINQKDPVTGKWSATYFLGKINIPIVNESTSTQIIYKGTTTDYSLVVDLTAPVPNRPGLFYGTMDVTAADGSAVHWEKLACHQNEKAKLTP